MTDPARIPDDAIRVMDETAANLGYPEVYRYDAEDARIILANALDSLMRGCVVVEVASDDWPYDDDVPVLAETVLEAVIEAASP